MQDDERHWAAIHEAGRAVSCVRLGVDCGPVSLLSGDGGTVGSWFTDGASHCFSSTHADAVAITYCAGYGALRAAGGSSRFAAQRCLNDFMYARELINFWQLDKLARIKSRAVELMNEPANRAAVAFVAHHLLLRTVIGEDVVPFLLAVSDGNASKSDLDTYLFRRAQEARQ